MAKGQKIEKVFKEDKYTAFRGNILSDNDLKLPSSNLCIQRN